MGIFKRLKKDNKPDNLATGNGVLGPTFLDGFTGHIQNPKSLQAHEWRRKLRTDSGQTKFKIKFYGQLHENYKNLIIGTDFAPSLIYAVDTETGQEILLFDGCRHGYNALFCDTFTSEQMKNRPVSNYYKDKVGNDIFEIIISIYYSVDYEDEFTEDADENGLIELIDGTKIEFEKAKRNGYGTIQIWATNNAGKTIDVVSEELS